MKTGYNPLISRLILKYSSTFLLLAAVLAFFILQFYFFSQHTQAFYFGDESEHLTPAWMMANFDKSLYTDISTNHQPIPIFASYVFIKTIQFDNLFMLVERTRQYIFVFSFLMSVLYVLIFRKLGLVAVILIEIIKFYFFGYHLLAESLTIYPVMIITGLILKQYFEKNKNISGELSKSLTDILFGLSVFVSAFSLLALWPFLAVCTFLYLIFSKKKSKIIILFSILAPALVLFTVIDFKAWFIETIYNVVKYFIPYESQTKTILEKIGILVYPFQAFFHLNSTVSRYIAALTILFLLSALILFRKSKKHAYFLLISYALLISLNLRIPKTNIGFYQAFHVLPFIGGLTVITLFMVKNSLQLLNYKFAFKFKFLIIFIFAILLFSSTQWWLEKPDKSTDHYVQYSELETVIYVLSNIKLKDDNLWVSPLDGMVNIISGLPLADRQNAHLRWAYRVPKLRNEFQNMMNNNPPTFILFYNQDDEYFEYMNPYLKSSYTNFVNKQQKPTKLFILNTEISQRSKEQWQAAGLRDYWLPEIGTLTIL